MEASIEDIVKDIVATIRLQALSITDINTLRNVDVWNNVQAIFQPVIQYVHGLERRLEDTQLQLVTAREQIKVYHAAQEIQASVRGMVQRKHSQETINTVNMGTRVMRQYLLKVDRFPGCHKMNTPYADSAPNFRRLRDLPIYGGAQPDLEGIHIILDAVARDGYKKVCCINLREEAVLFVKGRPYTARSSGKLNENDLVPGVTGHTIEVVENSLAISLKEELQKSNGVFKYWWEQCLGSNELCASLIDPIEVLTLPELYKSITHPGIETIEYHRIPIERENAPEQSDLHHIITLLKKAESDTAFIYNCQTSLLTLKCKAMVFSALALTQRQTNHSIDAKRDDCSPSLKSTSTYKEGAFRVILELMKELPNGCEAKQWVDREIDECDIICNLREQIDEFRLKSLGEAKPAKRSMYLQRACNFLERYFYLIVFACFLLERKEKEDEDKDVDGDRDDDFSCWLHRRPQLFRLLDNLGGVKYHGKQLFTSCVLKLDHFPGIHKLPSLFGKDVPNFRRIKDIPLYGVAQCTEEGIYSVVKYITQDEGYKKILWISLREEAVVFVRGRPFVIRHHDNLCNNVDYPGIEFHEIDAMESKLKKELSERVIASNGLFFYWHEPRDFVNDEASEFIDVLHDIKTLKEIYDLPDQAIHVRYARIPVSDETAPEEKDFDDLVRLLRPAYENEILHDQATSLAVVCNCQMGRGRTTTALVSIYMLRKVLQQSVMTKSNGNVARTNDDCERDKQERWAELSGGAELLRDATSTEPTLPSLRRNVSLNTAANLFGEYHIILQLLDVLENGRVSKQLVDEAIDSCDAMQNLRECIAQCRDQAYERDLPSERHEYYLKRAVNYLERYFYLICFGAYLLEQALEGFEVLFVTWMNTRYGESLYGLLDNLYFQDAERGTNVSLQSEHISSIRWRWRRKRKLISRLE